MTKSLFSWKLSSVRLLDPSIRKTTSTAFLMHPKRNEIACVKRMYFVSIQNEVSDCNVRFNRKRMQCRFLCFTLGRSLCCISNLVTQAVQILIAFVKRIRTVDLKRKRNRTPGSLHVLCCHLQNCIQTSLHWNISINSFYFLHIFFYVFWTYSVKDWTGSNVNHFSHWFWA